MVGCHPKLKIFSESIGNHFLLLSVASKPPEHFFEGILEFEAQCRLLVGVMMFNQQRKCILVAEKNFTFSIKTLSLCFFLERFFLFFDLDCQNLTMLGFDNCLISENEKSLAEKATLAWVSLLQRKSFPVTRNIYL